MSWLIVSDDILLPGEERRFRITKDENIIIENNTGVVYIETPNEKYNINLENFEVNLRDGKN